MGDDGDRKLFEEALASMSAAELYRGKYGSADTPSEDPPADAGSREELARLREQIEMERAFSGISPIEQRDKYYAPGPRDEGERPADDLRAEFEAAIATKPAPSAAPQPARRSLAETAPPDVHSYNMRGMEPDKALGKLGLFVDLAAKDGHGLIRVRIGSNPPLLNAVRAWFKGPGLSYVDEVEIVQEHEDAAIFARIRREQHA